MFSEMILKITNYVYWDFLSTLSAMLLGIFFTWLFSKHYYSKANEYFRRLNAIFSKEISKLSKEKFDIKYDEKGMPIEIVFISMSGTLNTKGELEVVKTKATNKDK
jgi:hypothetical protein